VRAAIYTRQSLDKAGEGAAVGRQETECRDLCERHGWAVAKVYIDNDRSATKGFRPAWAELLADLRGGRYDVLVCWHTDRLYRRLRDLVDDVIAEARRRGIRVGPGRGSGAGSRVLYCLGVTQVEPIAHGLLFERFLDPARPGMPDVDIDFQADRRDELYRYAADKYGIDYVARIGAVGMAWARKAIRSVGRVTAQDELADTLARLVPGSSASLASALDPAVPEGAALRAAIEGNADAAALVAAAQAVEGVASASSVHACGVVFGDEPLTSLVPVRRIVKDPNHPPVTEWDSVDLEEFGLVKFDFLAIADLVVVDKAVEFIKGTTGETVDPEQASLDPSDPKAAAAYRLLAEGRTAGVFQLASHGMTELSKAVKPNSLNDIAALVALYRPGPLKEGMHKAYASRKHGADVDYGIFTDDPVEQELIASVLGDTFGVIAFQEQMQQLSGVVAGYSKTDSYKLLKLVAKKKRAQLDLEYPKFVAGGKANTHSDGRAKVAFRQSTHGEPWFEGGPAGRAQWTQKWQQFTRGGTYESLRAAYNQAELAAFDEMARLFPARVNLSMATGWAFNDQCTGSNAGLWANPSCHPQRLATWTAVRAKYGNRAVFQENGAGDPENNGNFDGARGFGAWLADSFGPNGVVPGVIGAQQVAGVVKKDGRMDADRFVRMVQVEGSRSRFLEVYETDLAYLNAGATDDARAMRNALQDATWR